jgi:hypothetical protein
VRAREALCSVGRGAAVFDTRILPSSKTTPPSVTTSVETFEQLASPALSTKNVPRAGGLRLLEKIIREEMIVADLIRLQADGLVGPDQRFHIDAWGKAAVNLIKHAHGDHARRGSAEYWCAEECAPVLCHRLGPEIRMRPIPYREKARLGACWISFHPADHIRGLAKIRIEQGSDVLVMTGDYKRT